jgi:hypothetical protein
MNKNFIKVLILCFTIGISSCNSAPETKTPYQKMEVVFKGDYNKSEIKLLLEKVLKSHGLGINEKSQIKAADVLVALRKSSKNGVTEMDILKYMDESHNSDFTFEYQAALSFTFLEID